MTSHKKLPDIVERLRKTFGLTHDCDLLFGIISSYTDDRYEAADYIERLRTTLKLAEDEIERQQAEVTRLRRLLSAHEEGDRIAAHLRSQEENCPLCLQPRLRAQRSDEARPSWDEAIEAAAKHLARETAHLILRMNRYADRFEKIPEKEPHAETVRGWVKELDEIDIRALARPSAPAEDGEGGLLDVLEEIVDYRGGAESALHDEYVMERVKTAIAKAKVVHEDAALFPLHEGKR